jgi:hypothetical protein
MIGSLCTVFELYKNKSGFEKLIFFVLLLMNNFGRQTSPLLIPDAIAGGTLMASNKHDERHYRPMGKS